MKLGYWIWGVIGAVLAVRGVIAFASDGVPGPAIVVAMVGVVGAFWLID